MNTIQDLVEEKNRLNLLAQQYLELYKKTVRQITTMNARIESECNHNWVRDKASYGEQTDYTCTICHLTR